MKSTCKFLTLFFVLALGLAACSVAPDVAGVSDEGASRAVTYTEDFSKCTATGTSYVTGSFTGNNSLKWYYVSAAWSGGTISGVTPVLGKGKSPAAEVYTTVADGVGTISFKAKKPYSTSVSIALKINGTTKATFTTSSTTAVTAGPYTINVAGSVKIELVQSSTSAGQASIDNITWTSYSTTASSSSVASSSSKSSSSVASSSSSKSSSSAAASSSSKSSSSVASSSSAASGTFQEDMSLSQSIRDYYRSAYGLTGSALKAKLVSIITAGYVTKSYAYLYTTYATSDKTSDGKVWDVYSDKDGTGLNRPYTFPFSDTCGTYSAEGDCFNREHVIPQSTFSEKSPMVSDAHHILPTDGKVNGMRSNYPHAKVATASWTSKNGGKLGTCATSGYTGTVFEPIDVYKGDIARNYLYFSIRYYNNSSCATWAAMNAGAKLKSWAATQYKAWAKADPVSAKEITRNNAIYAVQKNRNPLIDYPVLVDMIDFCN